ncbi:MAG TPA: DinB family protein [Thermomicrobiales bacterium]|nr:DinB family protein [Thermomicrobiales bacterium]
MDRQEREALIARYKRGYQLILDAIEGMTDAEWDAREAPGEWSPREVIHHLADSEMNSAIRIRKLIIEDSPQIQGYDQEEYARRLHYDRPIENSLLALQAARATSAELLDRMSDEDWQSAGTHTESGPYTAHDWLRVYAEHCEEHAEQIRRAREVVVGNREAVSR